MAAAATLLDVVYASLRTASLWPLSRPYWTRSTPSFAPPGRERRAGAGRLLLVPY